MEKRDQPESEASKPLKAEDFLTGKEGPLHDQIMGALDQFEKSHDAAKAAGPAGGDEAKTAKEAVLKKDVKELGVKYEGVRDEVRRLSQEIGSGKFNPKQVEFKTNLRDKLKKDYFRELVESVVYGGGEKMGTEIVKLSVDFDQEFRDQPFKEALQSVSDTLLETTGARGQFETLISGPQKGGIAVEALRRRISENLAGITKAMRSRLEIKYGARGDRAKELAAARAKLKPAAKVIPYTKETRIQQARKMIRKAVMDARKELFSRPEKKEEPDSSEERAA